MRSPRAICRRVRGTGPPAVRIIRATTIIDNMVIDLTYCYHCYVPLFIIIIMIIMISIIIIIIIIIINHEMCIWNVVTGGQFANQEIWTSEGLTRGYY